MFGYVYGLAYSSTTTSDDAGNVLNKQSSNTDRQEFSARNFEVVVGDYGKTQIAEGARRLFQPPLPNNQVEEVSRKIEKLAKAYGLPIMTYCTRKLLMNIIRRIRPRRILEIGTLLGYSTILIGNELDKDAEIVTVEIVREIAQMAQENISRARILPTVRIMVGRPKSYLNWRRVRSGLHRWKKKDLDYIRAVESKLHTHSVVVADNYVSYRRECRNI
jgi:predicted O-methyltransferase YrrM